MPAWPGGPCPNCGEPMPKKQIHCVACRTLLNPALQPRSVDVPTFKPLKELRSLIELAPDAYTIHCPHCTAQLQASEKDWNSHFACRSCDRLLDRDAMSFLPKSFHADCPHCDEPLRISAKHAGRVVACNKCDGQISLFRLAAAITVEKSGETTIVTFSVSKNDISRFDQIAEELTELVEAAAMQDIVFNMEGVRYLHSVALGKLLKFNARVNESGGRLCLYNVRPGIRECLRTAQLEPLFNIRDDQESALATMA